MKHTSTSNRTIRLATLYKAGLVLLLLVCVAAIGVYIQHVSHAATSWLSLEPENGTPRGVTVVSDSSSSGGRAVKFGLSSVAMTKQILGVSATRDPISSSVGYSMQIAKLNAKAMYYYGTINPRWQAVSFVPDDHDIVYQTKDTTYADYGAMLASFPASRVGKVYLHYHNEPEDQLIRGDFTMAQYQARTNALYDAMDAAIVARPSMATYLVKGIEIQFYGLQQFNKGNVGVNNSFNVPMYIQPRTQWIGWSFYADKKASVGPDGKIHEYAVISPTIAPGILGTFMRTRPNITFSVITGWAVDTAYLQDPITIQNRVDWLVISYSNLSAIGSKHYLWFDKPWTNGDYSIENDPALLAAWQTL